MVKQGERPPDGVKALVVKLAGRNLRPPNPVIQAVVKESFGIKVSIRTIGRYCQKAGLPTSGHSTEERGQSRGY